MSAMTIRRGPARKVLGSLGVLGVAAAAAGLGTFGTFTDSTAVDTTVESGILSIDLGAPGGLSKTIPVLTNNFVPGDSLTRAINLENSGDVALSSVRLATAADPSNDLTADRLSGLQLTLQQCSRAWTRGGTTELPSYSCAGTTRTLYTGPAVSTAELPTPNSLSPGADDNLTFTLSLPTTAGNELQRLSTTVNLAFSAVQATGTAR
jgi:hypothetical protein